MEQKWTHFLNTLVFGVIRVDRRKRFGWGTMLLFSLLCRWVSRPYISHCRLCFFRSPTPYSGENEVVSEFVGLVLAIIMSMRHEMVYPNHTDNLLASSTAQPISSCSMRYIGGMTWGGILYTRSPMTSPTWELSFCRINCSVEVNAVSGDIF
jgi:hypothetical protein